MEGAGRWQKSPGLPRLWEGARGRLAGDEGSIKAVVPHSPPWPLHGGHGVKVGDGDWVENLEMLSCQFISASCFLQVQIVKVV